jgi:ferritin-like metal-binding protein YciE
MAHTKASRTAKTKNKASDQDNLSSLLHNKLKALYDIETQLVKALPAMAKNATDADLKKGFSDHLEQTKGHAQRLEEAFKMLGQKPQKLACDGIRGIIADAQWVIKNVEGDAPLDANLIAAAQYAEHYEMAGYGSALEWARRLNQNDIASLLEKTLNEEKEASEKLSDLAEEKIDEGAMSGANEAEKEQNNGW